MSCIVVGSAKTYNLETANWRDINELRKLEKICFPDDCWPLIDLLGVLTFNGIVRFKAVIDSKMIGFAAGDTRTEHELGWISTIGVHPDYRKQGIGAALMNACEQALNVSRVRLNVRISNKSAIHLYQGMGYREVTVWQGYYQNGEDALVLEKEILFR